MAETNKDRDDAERRRKEEAKKHVRVGFNVTTSAVDGEPEVTVTLRGGPITSMFEVGRKLAALALDYSASVERQ